MTGIPSYLTPNYFSRPLQSSPVGGDAAAASSSPNWLLQLGAYGSLIGGAMSTVGAFYGAKVAKETYRQQAMSAEFAQSMANRNARLAEIDAQAELDAGRLQAQQSAMGYNQAAGEQIAQQGAAGVDLSSGNALEQRVSLRLAQRIEALTINRNTVRAARAARIRATDLRSQGAMAGVSARNLRAAGSSISPGMAGFAGLLDAAGRAAPAWYAYSRNT